MAVWTVNGSGHLVDVTRKRLDLVAANAATLWKGYLKDRATKGTDVRGVLGAWCADEYSLGEQATCESALQSALKAGLLRVGAFGPMGAAYIKALKQSLAKWGYTRS